MNKKLNFKFVVNECENFSISENNSYSITYREFLKYFENIDKIDKHNLIISSHFVYGWMPTIINLKTDNLDRVLKLLNEVKNGHILNVDELGILKNCINNSLVGLSKLLHFINPQNYAIWDSRIFRFLTDKKSQYGISNPKTYLQYLEEIKNIENENGYSAVHKKIEKCVGYKLFPTRAIEILMFEADKKQTSN